ETLSLRIDIFRGSEASAQTILRYNARYQEISQVLPAARFCASAGHFESSKRLPLHGRTGDRSIDVQVSADHFCFGFLEIRRTARVTSAGESKLTVVGEPDSLIEVFCFRNRQDRSEDFLLKQSAA